LLFILPKNNQYIILENTVVKNSEIKVRVGLNAEQVPVKLEWMAEDNPEGAKWSEIKGMLFSIFDKDSRDTLKIDLWTDEMRVDEMNRFFYQALRSMTDTFYRATQNAEMANEMQGFVQYFGEKTNVLQKEDQQ
jgi:gliding motility-associated protein GldC